MDDVIDHVIVDILRVEVHVCLPVAHQIVIEYSINVVQAVITPKEHNHVVEILVSGEIEQYRITVPDIPSSVVHHETIRENMKHVGDHDVPTHDSHGRQSITVHDNHVAAIRLSLQKCVVRARMDVIVDEQHIVINEVVVLHVILIVIVDHFVLLEMSVITAVPVLVLAVLVATVPKIVTI